MTGVLYNPWDKQRYQIPLTKYMDIKLCIRLKSQGMKDHNITKSLEQRKQRPHEITCRGLTPQEW